MKKYIWLFLFLLPLTGCAGMFGGGGPVDYNTAVALPPLESAYPSDDVIGVLEEEFAKDKMEWTAVEIGEIAMHRNAILGIFWYLKQKRELTSNVSLYTAKDSLEQVLAHYNSLKAVLSTRRIKMTMMTGLIYDATIRDSNRVLSGISEYLNTTEQDLNSKSSSIDSKYLEMAWGYMSPLVGTLTKGLSL